MAEEVAITELVVDARGAQAGSAAYVRAMQAAQAAVDRLRDREDALAQAQAKGGAAMIASATTIQRTAQAWDRLRSSIDPVAAAEIRAQREIERATIAADNAVKRGLATETQAAAVLERLRSQQIVDLQRVRDAQQQVTDSRIADARVANDNAVVAGGGPVNTANLAAQFQDIAVTSANGLDPLQIALQQGTQISAVLGPMGAAGAVQSLAAAFVSLINPVSLFTIAAVAAVAAAIQFVGSISSETPKAEDALKAHLAMIEQLTRGYERAREAATGTLERAQMLPRGVVLSDLGASLREQEEAAGKLQERINGAQAELRDSIELFKQIGAVGRALGGDTEDLQALQAQVESIEALRLSTSNTVPEIQAAMEAARELYNVSDDPAIREMANDSYELGLALLAIEANAYASRAAISALKNEAVLTDAIADAERFATAIGRINGLAPELRSTREQARDALNDALGSGDAIQRQAAQAAYDQTIAALDEADRRDKAAADARRATSAARRESPADKFGGNVTSLEQEIEGLRMQAEAMGQTSFAVEKARTETELYNQAKEAGLEITPELSAQIADLATRYGEAQLALEGARLEMENLTPLENLGLELQRLDELLAAGAISWDTYARAVGGATASAAGEAIGALANLSSSLSSAFEDNKELAIATAVLKGAEAVASAYAAGNAVFGPIGGAAFAAVAALAAAKNVADVASVTRTSKSASSSSSAGATPAVPAATQQPNKFVQLTLVGQSVSTETVGGLFERLNSELDDRGMKVAVSYK